jgi:hypothetical protein
MSVQTDKAVVQIPFDVEAVSFSRFTDTLALFVILLNGHSISIEIKPLATEGTLALGIVWPQ